MSMLDKFKSDFKRGYNRGRIQSSSGNLKYKIIPFVFAIFILGCIAIVTIVLT